MRRLNNFLSLTILAFILSLGLSLPCPAFSQNSTQELAAQTNSTATEQVADEQIVKLELEELVPALHAIMDKAEFDKKDTGAVVLISRDGKIIYHRAIGYIDPNKKSPMLENAIFRLASVSKLYTSMAAAALLDQGKLALNDPITKYLPRFTPKLESGKTPEITIKQLMSHTAGLNYTFFEQENGPYHKAKVSDGLNISNLTTEENLDRIASAPLLFEPGTKWHYSLATDVLGAAVAKANNSTLPEALEALITRPLSMEDTGFKVTAPNRLVVPYYLNGENLQPMPNDLQLPVPGGSSIHFSPGRALLENEYPSGGAGMVGTAPDLLKLLEFIRLEGNPSLKIETMQAMGENQISKLSPEAGHGFSLGWGIVTDPSLKKTPLSVGTMYWSGVYGHNWYIDPVQRLAIVILTNTAMDDSLNDEIINTLYQYLPTAP